MQAMSPVLAFAFVNQLFLLTGLGLIAVPIIIHILNRQRFKIVEWAAMEFLLRAMRKNRKRMKLEQWILLATRCAVVALIGFAIARPLGGCSPNSFAAGLATKSGLNVFVIDNSYSASYEIQHAPVPGPDGTPLPPAKTHLEQQKLMAKRLIDTLGGGGESVAIVTAARPSTAIIAKPGYNMVEAKAVVDRIEQSYAGTDLAGALQQAIQIADEDDKVPTRTLYVFTDGTRSAWEGQQADALKRLGPEVAKRFRVTHFNMTEGKQQWNDAVLDVSPKANLVTTKFDSDLTATVRGFGASADASVIWTLDGQPLGDRKVIKPEPSTGPQLLTLKPQNLKFGGAHLVTVTVNGDQPADALKIDDRRYRVIDAASEVKILIVEGVRRHKSIESAGSFLQSALAPISENPDAIGKPKSTTHVSADVITDGELDRMALEEYRAVALCDVSQLKPEQADAIAKFVTNGGSLLIFMGEQVNKEKYNDTLLPRKLLPGPLVSLVDTRVDGNGYVFDFKPSARVVHPFLDVFKGMDNTGLDTARINAYWKVDISGTSGVQRVLSYLPAPDPTSTAPKALPGDYRADPAITVHSVGYGSVVFISTSANPISFNNADDERALSKSPWHDLAPRPAWVALAHEMLAGSVSTSDGWMNRNAGESLEIPSYVKLSGQPELTDDAGIPIAVSRNDDPKKPGYSYISRPLARPGVYKLKLSDKLTVPIAVNVASDEADVRTIGNESVRKALGDIPMTLINDELPIEAVVAAKDGDDWTGILLMALLVFLGIECVMAMRFGHYRRTEAVRV